MTASKASPFTGFRSYLWPIHRHELKKFIPMLLMFFLISFNYNILRASKDALVITAPEAGAEVLPFIKVWAILPMAILLTFIFTRLSNRFSREKVFYWMIGIFLGFFALFTFVLYPFQEALHPHFFANYLEKILPSGLKGLVALLRNWTFTAFYVMSELWGTAVMSVLFWGFANEVTNVWEAKRFYGILGIGANLAGIVAGQIAKMFSKSFYFSSIPFGTTSWDQTILFVNCSILFSGLLIVFLFHWLSSRVVGDAPACGSKTQEKIKMSMRKNFKYLAKSKYLICIAAIVIMYNVGLNLIEVVWKDQIRQLYPNPNDYNLYMADITTFIGIVATLISIFITGNVLRKFSWTTSALIPPLIMIATGTGFFFCILSQNSGFNGLALLFGISPLAMSVFLGGLQNSLARASKYTLFDATKELSFIPLSRESKLKGKAAIDGVGSRIGKSGGSVIHQGLLIFTSTVAASTPFVGLIFFGVVGIWIFSVISLGKQFNAKIKLKAEQEQQEKKALAELEKTVQTEEPAEEALV